MVLEGVNKGMGKHNEAVTNEDDRVAALMVRSVGASQRPLAYIKIVASSGDGRVHPGHDVHQAKHRHFPSPPGCREGIQVHSDGQLGGHRPLELGHLPVGRVPMQSGCEAVGL